MVYILLLLIIDGLILIDTAMLQCNKMLTLLIAECAIILFIMVYSPINTTRGVTERR